MRGEPDDKVDLSRNRHFDMGQITLFNLAQGV